LGFVKVAKSDTNSLAANALLGPDGQLANPSKADAFIGSALMAAPNRPV
jgi:hypothetical protein